ncbi:MAG: transposase [Armatimonadota bacterium]
MGRRHRTAQRSFADPEVALQRRPLRPDSFEVRFREMADQYLPDALFDDLYSANGRPAISPTAVTRLLLLQLKYGRSDRQALEDLNYDVRWQYMVDLPLEACDFDPTVLAYHRLRLLYGTIDRAQIRALQAQGIDLLACSPAQRVFDALVQLAIGLGLLDPAAAQGIDSTAILGAAAIQDAYRLLFQALRQVLQAAVVVLPAETQAALLAHLRRPEYLSRTQTKPVIAWDDPAARQALLTEYVLDAAQLATACREVDDPAVQDALAQLQRLIGQDLDVAADHTATLKPEVAPDRQCSVVDPELRHGRKSKSRRFNGYKAHLRTEPTSGLITAVTTTLGNLHDNTAVSTLLARDPPPVAIGDQAYGGLDTRQQALAQGVALLTPALTVHPFDKAAFTLDEPAGTLTCPAGHTVRLRRDGEARFPTKVCQACPHRAQCCQGQGGRQVNTRPGESLVRDLQDAARQPETAAEIRRVRAATERIIGHFIRACGRKGRAFGRLNTGLQVLLGAIGYNLDRLGRLLQRRPADSAPRGAVAEASGCAPVRPGSSMAPLRRSRAGGGRKPLGKCALHGVTIPLLKNRGFSAAC